MRYLFIPLAVLAVPLCWLACRLTARRRGHDRFANQSRAVLP